MPSHAQKLVLCVYFFTICSPYYRLTKAAAATFGWLSNTRDDYDVTQPIEENEADSQDDLRVWDLAETILHKDDMFGKRAHAPVSLMACHNVRIFYRVTHILVFYVPQPPSLSLSSHSIFVDSSLAPITNVNFPILQNFRLFILFTF